MNTANPNTDMKPLFLDDYNKAFKDLDMRMIIGEYHQPNCKKLEDDLSKAKKFWRRNDICRQEGMYPNVI